MKKKLLSVFLVMIIGIIIVICFLIINNKGDNEDIIYFDYIENESDAIYYTGNDGFIYAVADLTSHLEDSEDLDYLVTGLFRKKVSKSSNKYELIYRMNFCNFKEKGYKNIQFFDNKLYILDCPVGNLEYIDLNAENLNLETLTKDYNKITGYRTFGLKSISEDGVLIQMESYHEATPNTIEVLCSLEDGTCETVGDVDWAFGFNNYTTI